MVEVGSRVWVRTEEDGGWCPGRVVLDPGPPSPDRCGSLLGFGIAVSRIFFKCGAVEVRASRKAGVGWNRRSPTFPFAPPALPFSPCGISRAAQHSPGFPPRFRFRTFAEVIYTGMGMGVSQQLSPGCIFSSLPFSPAFVDVVHAQPAVECSTNP